MFCPNCGQKIEDDVRFCPSCGMSPHAQPVTQPQRAGTRDSGGGGFLQNNGKLLIISATVVISLALIVVMVICLVGNAPDSAPVSPTAVVPVTVEPSIGGNEPTDREETIADDPIPSSPIVVQDLQSFGYDRLLELECEERDFCAVYAYYTITDQTFLNEYLAVLQEDFRLCNSVPGSIYCYVYAGSESAQVTGFDAAGLGITLDGCSDIHLMVVYEDDTYGVALAPGLTFADAGYRTTVDLFDPNADPDPAPTVDAGPCRRCEGDGKIDCVVCKGMGYLEQPSFKVCIYCGGVGYKDCTACD